MSAIEWTDETWNPVTGCTKVSAGCKHCYAERMAKRLKAMGSPKYLRGFAVTEHPDALDEPRRWRKPRRVFVNSMSDLFHPDVSPAFVSKVLGVIRECPQHTFQILTKRPMELTGVHGAFLELRLHLYENWPRNAWLGVSVESAEFLRRAYSALFIPAPVHFLSCEPLLGALPSAELQKCFYYGIDWVIVGGESGPKARPMNPDWVRGIRDDCLAAGVRFFFKQWGGKRKKVTGRVLDGRTWDQIPDGDAARD